MGSTLRINQNPVVTRLLETGVGGFQILVQGYCHLQFLREDPLGTFYPPRDSTLRLTDVFYVVFSCSPWIGRNYVCCQRRQYRWIRSKRNIMMITIHAIRIIPAMTLS